MTIKPYVSVGETHIEVLDSAGQPVVSFRRGEPKCHTKAINFLHAHFRELMDDPEAVRARVPDIDLEAYTRPRRE